MATPSVCNDTIARPNRRVHALVGCCLLALAARPAAAQDLPRVELSGGYAFSGDLDFNGHWPLGGFAGAAWPAAEWLAVSAEVAGHRRHEASAGGGVRTDASLWSALFGARVSRRLGGSLTMFMRGASGMTRVTNHTYVTSPPVSGLPSFDVAIAITAPAVQFGGGADVGLGKRLSMRTLVEYRRIFGRRLQTLELPVHDSIEVSAGVVIGLGSR